MNKTSRSQKRETNVDAVRCLAIFGVIATHAGLIHFGRFGVQLFFLVTGYLIADLNYRSPKQFITRRFFRLWPAFALFTLTIIFFEIEVLVYPSLDFLQNPLQLILTFAMLSNLIPGTAFVAGSWSVSNEWIFSLVIIFRKKIYDNFNVIFFVLVGIQFIIQLIVLILTNNSALEANSERYWKYVWFNTLNPIINLPFFLLGFGIKVNKIKLMNIYYSLALIALSIAVDLKIGHAMPIWLLGCLALFSICSKIDYSINLSRVLNFIGKRTYGIFLSHYFVIQITNKYLNESLFGNLMQSLLVFFTCIIIGEFSWKIIEKPSLKLSSIIEKKI